MARNPKTLQTERVYQVLVKRLYKMLRLVLRLGSCVLLWRWTLCISHNVQLYAWKSLNFSPGHFRILLCDLKKAEPNSTDFQAILVSARFSFNQLWAKPTLTSVCCKLSIPWSLSSFYLPALILAYLDTTLPFVRPTFISSCLLLNMPSAQSTFCTNVHTPVISTVAHPRSENLILTDASQQKYRKPNY